MSEKILLVVVIVFSFNDVLMAEEKELGTRENLGVSEDAYRAMLLCHSDNKAIDCNLAALWLNMENHELENEYYRKTCIARQTDPAVRPGDYGLSCKKAGMSLEGKVLNSAEIAAWDEEIRQHGNLLQGGAETLKKHHIQEALDVIFLISQGIQPNEATLKDCRINNGCAVVFGVVRARLKLHKIGGCSLVEENLARCQFEYKASSESAISPGSATTSFGNSYLGVIQGVETFEADSLLRLVNGNWRIVNH